MLNRRGIFAAVAVVAMLGLVASAAWAHCGKCGPKPTVTTITGAVKSVDATARSLVLTTGEGDSAKDVTLKVCPKAKIVVNGKTATLADLKAGVKVQVCHKNLVAVRITVGTCGSKS